MRDYKEEAWVDEFFNSLTSELDEKVKDVAGYEKLRFYGTGVSYGFMLARFAFDIAASEEVVIVAKDVYYLYKQVFYSVGLERYEQYETYDYTTRHKYDQMALIGIWAVDDLSPAGQAKIEQFEADAKRYKDLEKMVRDELYNLTYELDIDEMLEYLRWRAGYEEYLDGKEYYEIEDVYIDLMERASDIVWLWMSRGEIRYIDDHQEQQELVYERVNNARNITSL